MARNEIVEKFVFDVGKGVSCEVYGGDASQEEVDALVIACAHDLKHSGDAAALIIIAGNAVVQECANNNLDSLQVHRTVGGELRAQNILHIVPPSKLHCGSVEAIALHTMYENALAFAKQAKFTSITFTGIARGIGFCMKQWSSSALSAIKSCVERGLGSIKTITFVDTNRRAICAIIDSFSKQWKMNKQPGPAWAFAVDQKQEPDYEGFDYGRESESPMQQSNSSSNSSEANEKITGQCCICLCEFSGDNPSHLLDKCQHTFHKDCIDQSFLKTQPQCPECKTWYGVPMGNMPKGHMQVVKTKGSVEGFICSHYYTIDYNIPGGIQDDMHLRPGTAYSGTKRTAYIPDTPEGQVSLSLLRLAFEHKLTFTVGDSVTSGQKNTVVWNSVHHKTSLTGGSTSFGYPDAEYLGRLEDELKNLGITRSMILPRHMVSPQN